jgi:heme-degrading monooxygenase HmoA
MIALFFEVEPRQGQDDRYLEIAGGLRPELERNGGVLFLDRYRSVTRPRVLLSHQIWHDEASLARWRANGHHYGAQSAGRGDVFENYRLRVGPVVAEGGEGSGVREMPDGLPYNDPVLTPERLMVVVRSHGGPFAVAAPGETFASVYRPGEHAWVGAVSDRGAAYDLLRLAAGRPCVSAAQLCLVSRDYGMFDRREAPQYFPPCEGRS